jgi:surface antigen
MLDFALRAGILVRHVGKFGRNFISRFQKFDKFLRGLTSKKVLTAQVILLIFAALVAPAPIQIAAADDLASINAQINALNDKIAKNRSDKTSVENEIATIDAQVQSINLQLTATQIQIDQLTAQINDTNYQIAKNEADLKVQQNQMAVYLKEMYEDGQVSIVEQIAKSNSFSDFVDQKEYLSTIQSKIKETADKITAIKKELEAKKKDLEGKKAQADSLKASQVAQQQAAVAQMAYKNQLLAQINSQAAGLQAQMNDLYARKAALSVTYGERISTGSSSYPYGNPPARGRIDTPDAYGYLIGECTSYAAWKRASIGRPVPRAMGNANMWPASARANGMSVNSTPRPGDVMVFPYLGAYGHVAFVEAVYGNGTILISEYNWTPYSYSQRVVNPYNYGGVFIH